MELAGVVGTSIPWTSPPALLGLKEENVDTRDKVKDKRKGQGLR